MPPYQEIVCYDFFFVFWTNSFIVQLGLGFKLITKVGLHNFPPPDPPFSPPQTFEPLLSYLGRSNLVCKVYGTQSEKY